MQSRQRVAKSLVRFIAIMSLALSLLSTATLRHSPETAVISATAPSNLLEAVVPNRVQVPPAMRSAPFDVQRTLNLPPQFQVAVYARIPGARFMAIAPSGDLLVSQPGDGKVVVVRPNLSGDPLISDFVTGLRKPQDIVFHTVGTTTYVYISESHQINRFIYDSGDLVAHDRQVVVANLPDSSSPELHGVYGHELKNMVLDANNKLYVSVASTCNACLEDTVSDPIRGAIYQYNADGSNGRLFAHGLRNAEGLAMLPGTNDLWVAVNNRDNIAYPLQDNTGNYGQVVQSYVDNHPPEEFTQVRDGGNYGWPFANPNPDTASGYDNMPFDLDVQFNADGHVALSNLDRINKGIQAHSAPLGLTFLQNSAFPSAYRAGAVIGLHGSWNRSQKTGYKVIYFPWNSTTQTPDRQADLITGWLNDADQTFWGRPVAVVVDLQGNLLISDDASGTVYKLIYGGSNRQLQLQAVSDAYHLDGPSLTEVADELVFSMGNTIFAVKTNGDVWAQDVVGHQVGSAYQLNSSPAIGASAKYALSMGSSILTVNTKGEVWAQDVVGHQVSQAYQLNGPPVATLGVPAKYVFTLGNRIFVANTNGEVWAHDVVGNQVGNAYQLNSPPVATLGIPAKYVFAVGNSIVLVNTSGEVWAYDVVGNQVGNAYQLSGPPVAPSSSPAKYAFALGSRIFVVNTNGDVWAHDLINKDSLQ